MKLDLIYVEGEHEVVPGVVRRLAADDTAAQKLAAELLSIGGRVYQQELSVDIPLAYSHLEMEAALCVWEHLCDITVNTDNPDKEWANYRESVGSVELRHESIEIGKWVLQVYDLLPQWYRDSGSYDWEIVPSIVSALTPGETSRDPQKTRDELVTSTWAKLQYLRDFNAYLKCHYGIDVDQGFGISVEEFTSTYFHPDIPPQELVDVIARKYDLERVR